MDKHKNLSKHLNWIRKNEGYTYIEFSDFLDVPKSTLQAVMADGNTTLATAVQISERLNIPLDVLLSDEPLDREFNVVRWCISGLSVFAALSVQQQEELTDCLNQLLNILHQE